KQVPETGKDRHSPDHLGIPQRRVPGRAPVLGAPIPDGVAGEELVAAGEKLPGPHRQRQDRDPQAQEATGHEVRAAGCVRRRGGGGGGGGGVFRCAQPRAPVRVTRNGTAAPSSVIVRSTREATASATASFSPSGPCNTRT